MAWIAAVICTSLLCSVVIEAYCERRDIGKTCGRVGCLTDSCSGCWCPRSGVLPHVGCATVQGFVITT
jgi:hypothetical protein